MIEWTNEVEGADFWHPYLICYDSFEFISGPLVVLAEKRHSGTWASPKNGYFKELEEPDYIADYYNEDGIPVLKWHLLENYYPLAHTVMTASIVDGKSVVVSGGTTLRAWRDTAYHFVNLNPKFWADFNWPREKDWENG